MSSRQNSRESTSPKPLHTTKSFTRMESPSGLTSPRKRASTLQEAGIPAVPEARRIDSSPEVPTAIRTDVFENLSEEEEKQQTTPGENASTPTEPVHLPATFEDLPIEIRSITERFLESLNAKIHPTPLSADALSDLFQDFYERAAAHIATHIATLSSRIGRGNSITAQDGSKKPVKGRSRAGSSAKRSEGSPSGGEMLTPAEVASRRTARRLLELKRTALEEAVERSVCERIYDRIWKHRSSDDDARDEKLRSRTAALAVVGIGLKELRLDSTSVEDSEDSEKEKEKEGEIHSSLAPAREALVKMNEERYPLGKLQHLTAAHKSIVETLSELYPSSSADEILPTLIYTLITSPPEGIDVVSNLNFIQRFRAAGKVDGEAAYCMVNLEAAISFLETVDLSSLRADELPEGPPKLTSSPSTPTAEISNPTITATTPKQTQTTTLKPELAPVSALSTSPTRGATSALSATTQNSATGRPPPQPRRISTLIQTQTDRLEAGRETFLNTADKLYDSVNGSLETSLQFVFGRFKEQQQQMSMTGGISVPRTLGEARRLVSSPGKLGEGEDAALDGHESPPASSAGETGGRDKVVELLGGKQRPPARERSVESTRSGGSASGKRVAFSSEAVLSASPTGTSKDASAQSPQQPQQQGMFSSMNPLKFNVPGFARFGGKPGGAAGASPSGEKTARLGDVVEGAVGSVRASVPLKKAASRDSMRSADAGPLGESAPAAAAGSVSEKTPGADEAGGAGGGGEDAEDDMNAREALAQLRQLKPPRKRFLEVSGAGELKLGEVEDLLGEYRRLAKAIGVAIAS